MKYEKAAALHEAAGHAVDDSNVLIPDDVSEADLSSTVFNLWLTIGGVIKCILVSVMALAWMAKLAEM